MIHNVPPEAVATVRRRYSAGDRVTDIQAATGMWSIDRFYKCLDGRYPDGSGAPLPLPRIPRRKEGVHAVSTAVRRMALVGRIWRSAEQQVDQIEARLAKDGTTPDACERDARSLAVLVRTLRELSEFEKRRSRPARNAKIEHDDPVPQDVDELRRELARRMQALIDSRAGAGISGGPEE